MHVAHFVIPAETGGPGGRFGPDQFIEQLGIERHASIHRQLDAAAFAARRQRQLRRLRRADPVGDRRCIAIRRHDLEMRRLGSRLQAGLRQKFNQPQQLGVEVDGRAARLAAQVDGAVQPTEFRFAFGVHVVVHLGRAGSRGLGAIEGGNQRVKAVAVATADGQRLFARVARDQLRFQLRDLLSRELVDLVDDDDVGLFDLFQENVGRLRGETDVAAVAENLFAMLRLQQHGQRGEFDFAAVKCAERFQDGRRQVGAAADRLGQDDIGTLDGREFADDAHQIVELAAETRAGHLADVEALRSERHRVDQSERLIVGDDADAKSAIGVMLSQLADQRRFAGPEKTADHQVSQSLHHRLAL